jgi:hypothetical protein
MKHRIAVVGLALAVLLSLIVAFNADAKDINLGWSGQGSWSTLPYIVAGERGFVEKRRPEGSAHHFPRDEPNVNGATWMMLTSATSIGAFR